jgi:hypothetical protein
MARAEARSDARFRDLDALQALGRSLAEARTVDEILDRAGESLQPLIDADAFAIASTVEECDGVRVYLARPLAPGDEDRLRETVALGFVALAPDAGLTRELTAFDRLQVRGRL